jgi:hypothetical protein
VEFALLLPLLAFLFVITIDFARVFYYTVTLYNCARNGAYYASNYPGIYAYTSASNAALADAPNLTPTPTVTTYYSATADGPYTSTTPITNGYVQVTVSWPFQTVTSYPGVPSTLSLSRSAKMKVAPVTPSNFP